MSSLLEHPTNILEPFISSITDNNTQEYVTQLTVNIKTEYNDLALTLESNSDRQSHEITNLKNKCFKSEQRINKLEQQNLEIIKQNSELIQDKNKIFYRQIVNEIYNIAIQKIMGWTRRQRQKNKINSYYDFELYIDEQEWDKYSELLNTNLYNMGISDDIIKYIQILKKDGNHVAHPDKYQYS